ncbi:10190_t:CDS:1 [Funneliformis geosporum]|uniref:17636_t:CDS:1 n=1 Tax=Funneliformis geosporum TaxID=1117311 RepID=A0A9W4SPZ3_9GLOM|nr:10190_t:CDS:1 [Funneliformis geosporum]CAI2178446.1 17636_t:CDS:1 [Funneliformis geosporum]
MKFSAILVIFAIFALLAIDVSAKKKSCIQKLNALDAKASNKKFKKLTPDSPCTTNEVACINGKFAKCDQSKFVLFECGPTLSCFALPLVNSRGTSVTCDTTSDAKQRIALAFQCRGFTG